MVIYYYDWVAAPHFMEMNVWFVGNDQKTTRTRAREWDLSAHVLPN
jgi:hypothetical protein